MKTLLLEKSGFRTPLLLLICLLSFGIKTKAQTLLPNFVDELVSSGWTEVEGFVYDSTGRMFVWEKAGKVWIVDTNGVKQTTPLIDISDEVGNWRDHGLNGFALDPNFLTNGYIYLFYTVDRHHLIYSGTPFYNPNTNDYYKATIVRVTRYQADISTNFTTLVPNSRFILLGETPSTGIPCLHESHTGGSLVFARDGSLIVSSGDGASYNLVDSGGIAETYYAQGISTGIIPASQNVGAFRSQMINSFNGKLFRLDPMTGNGLSSNPYYEAASPRSAKSRMWACGFRNPFRINIRPNTGETDITAGEPGKIYVGDVEWSTWEDLKICDEPGQNFGWPLFEGLTPQPGYMATTTKNQDAPNPLFGTGGCTKDFFMFKDLCKQETLNTTNLFMNPCNASIPIAPTTPTFMRKRPAADWSHGSVIARVPTFDVNGNATTYTLGSGGTPPVTGPSFQGNCSAAGCWYTSDKFPYQYQNSYFHIDFGGQWIKNFVFDSLDNLISIQPFASNIGAIVYLATNPRTGTLDFVNYGGEIRRIRYTLGVNNPPVAIATADTSYGASPLTVNFTGGNSYDPEGLPLTYLWNFGDGFTDNTPNPTHVFTDASNLPHTYNVTLTVFDAINQSSVAKVKIYLNNTPPVVNIISILDSSLYSIDYQTVLPLNAIVTDAEHGPNQLFYSWETILYHNNHNHPEPGDTNKVSTTIISPTNCDVDVFHYKIRLTVTDADGLSGSDEVDIYPACDKPAASFISNNNVVCVGQQIQFTDQSSSIPTTYEWFFNGGSPQTSTDINPLVQYNTTGVYDVKLIVSSSRGSDTLLLSNYVTVSPYPVINFGNDTALCSGTNLDAGNAGASYLWNDGTTTQNYNVQASGNYQVLVTYPGGCSASDDINLTVSSAPTVSLGNDSSTCNLPVTLDAGAGNVSYLWSNGETTQTILANATNVYQVTVTDANNGCTSSDAVSIAVNSLPVVNLGSDTTTCNTQLVLDAGAGNAIYLWSNGETTQTILANATDVYEVTVTDNNGCVNNDAVSIAINTLPIVNLGSDTATCNQAVALDAGAGNVSYLWSNGETTQTISATSTAVYQVTITDNNGCENNDAVSITINSLPVINLGNDSSTCNLPVTLDAGAGSVSYLWSNGETTQTISANFSSSFEVTITDANGCKNADVVNITINALPIVALGNDTTTCNLPLTLDAGAGNVSYLWSNGETTQTISADATSLYEVTVTDNNGCVNSDAINFTINALPSVELGNDSSTCNLPITLDAGAGNVSYLWSNGETTQTISATTSAIYEVTITDVNGCSNADAVTIAINSLPVVNLGSDTATCNTPLILDAGAGNNSYLWSNGETTQTISGNITSLYEVTVTDNNGCVNSDAINFTINALPSVELGNDSSTCNQPVTLDAGAGSVSYLWSNGETTQTISASSTFIYQVTITDANGCENSDAVTITINPLPIVNLGNDTATCNSPLVLDAGTGNISYMWSNGSTTQTISVNSTSLYEVTVTDNNGCVNSDAINFTINPIPTVTLGNDTTTCNIPVSLDAGNGFASYLWSNGETTQIISAGTTSAYQVTVTDANGCTNTDVALITIHLLPNVTFNAFVTDTFCITDGQQFINSGFPGGGTFSGSGVNGNIFNPAVGLGWHVINYAYTDLNGCSNSKNDSVFVDACTGINQLQNNSGVSVYPNPTTGILHIIYPFNNSKKLSVEIVNELGNTVKSFTIAKNNTDISIQQLPNGIYTLKVYDAATLISVNKVVKMQ